MAPNRTLLFLVLLLKISILVIKMILLKMGSKEGSPKTICASEG